MVAEVLLRQRASRPRRSRGISRGILGGFSALLGLVLTFALLPMASAAAAAPAQSGPVTMSIAPDAGGVLTHDVALNVTVTIENTGSEALSPGTADLWMNPTALGTRSALDSWLSQTTAPSGTTRIGSVSTATIEPGIPYTYRISVPAASLPFANSTTPGSFGIGATLESASTSAANATGVVVWDANGSAAANPTRVAVAVPLTAPPSSNGIISAADLATYTAPNGLLTRELNAIATNPSVTVGIDPMIIASIRALNDSAPASAIAWLKELSEIVNPTFALQYGDADPAGQAQAGLTKLLQPTSLTFAMNPANFKSAPTPIGEPPTPTAVPTPTPTATPGAPKTNLPTTSELLAWNYTLSGVAWPSDGTVRTSDISAFAANGLRTTLLSTSNTNASSMQDTPNAAVKSGAYTALAADAGISNAVRAATTATTLTAWNASMSEVSAQLQLVSAQSSSPRTILVTLGRDAPTVNGQLDHVLNTITNSPWSTPASLEDALNAAPTSGLTVKDTPESAARVASIQYLMKRETAVDQFATVLDTPDTLSGQTRARLLTTLGVGWQSPKQNWDLGVNEFLTTTSRTLNSVSILATDNVNLVGTQGSIPFTVSNELNDEAVTVVLSAIPSNGRLEIDGDTTKTIQADSRTTILVPVKAELGNGKVTLQLRLYSKTGVQIGSATSVPVEVHADWEGIGALIVGILLVLLFGFGIVRNILRRRGKDEPAGSDAGAEDDRDKSDEDGSVDGADGVGDGNGDSVQDSGVGISGDVGDIEGADEQPGHGDAGRKGGGRG